MDISRTGKLIVSCCGAAIVVAAAGIIWLGMESKGRSAEDRRSASGLVPVKLGPPKDGPAGGTIGPVPVAGTVNEAPGSIAGNLVLVKGETFYGKGEAFFKDGDFSSASRYLRAEVDKHPDRFYPTFLLGLSLWKEGKTDEAITTLTSAASLDKDSVKARVNLGRVLNDAGTFTEALEAADEAIALDQESSQAHNVRGRALLNLGRKDEAIEAFKTAIEKDATNAYAQNNLGYALIGEGRFADAVPYLEEAVRLEPRVGHFQNNLGMAYERTAQIDKAKGAYGKAVQAGGSDFAERNLARLGGTVDDENPEPSGDDASN
jgi:Flp pilus assembly protein TadD